MQKVNMEEELKTQTRRAWWELRLSTVAFAVASMLGLLAIVIPDLLGDSTGRRVAFIVIFTVLMFGSIFLRLHGRYILFEVAKLEDDQP